MSASPPAPPPPSSSASSSASSGARRQRVLWDSDSTSRGGKTSIGILLEWLLAPGNYGRWRDGKSQTGETREALCSEIKGAMQQHGIHHRENANIRTQISELERSFDAARNWLKENSYDRCTFQRVTDGEEEEEQGEEEEAEEAGTNGDEREEELGVGKKEEDGERVLIGGAQGPAEAHVLRMCRYYHTLNEVFGHDEGTGVRHRRASAQRTGNHPASTRKRKGTLAGADSVHKVGQLKEAVADGEQPRRQVDMASVPEATAAMPVAAALNDLEHCTTPSAAIPAAAMAETWVHPAALESTQRMVAEAVREERERKRFCMEEERHQLECDRLRYEIEAAKLQLTIDRALARKRLFDAGLPGAQVNELFPK